MSGKGIPWPVWAVGAVVAAFTVFGNGGFGNWVGHEGAKAGVATGKGLAAAAVGAGTELSGEACPAGDRHTVAGAATSVRCAFVPLNPAGDANNLAGVRARTGMSDPGPAGGTTVTAAPSSPWSSGTVPPRPGPAPGGPVPPRPTTAWTTPPRPVGPAPAAPPVTAPPGPPTPPPPAVSVTPAPPAPSGSGLPQLGEAPSSGILGELPEAAQEGLKALTAGVG